KQDTQSLKQPKYKDYKIDLPKFEDDVDLLKNLTVTNFFKIFSNFYPYIDIYQQNLVVSDVEVNYILKKAKYRFHNSKFIIESEDFIYHFYIFCGIIESTISKALKKRVICNVEKINVTKNESDSYVDISIEIK
ncbi:MAG: hypothetical protein ACFFAO_14425, partial [Candidatus Hermodarchaeota archaeon]